MQRDDRNKSRIVAYRSQTLNQAERGYNVYDKELLAVLRALRHWRHYVMTVRLGLLFFSSIPPPLPYGLCASSPIYLHALPSPLRYHICVHQYLLMCTLCALFVPASPHRYLMYHCTFCARFPTL